MSQIETTYSGDSAKDTDYPLICLIDANGVVWKLRVGTDGVLTTETA